MSGLQLQNHNCDYPAHNAHFTAPVPLLTGSGLAQGEQYVPQRLAIVLAASLRECKATHAKQLYHVTIGDLRHNGLG